MLNAGDKCPQCRQGLLERTATGLECANCDFKREVDELVDQAQQQKISPTADYTFKPVTLKLRLEDPEEGELLLQGAIIARSNNSAPHWNDLIDGLNQVLQPWRAAKLQADLAVRDGG